METESDSILNEDFQTSLSGFKCIGPCYRENTYIKHPVTKNIVTMKHNFCPINPTTVNDNVIEVDECENITGSFDNNINIFRGHFNYSNFLKTFYNISSFQDAINYINTNNVGIYTEKRILNSAWNAYAYNKDNIPKILENFYIDKFKNQWYNEYNYKHKIPPEIAKKKCNLFIQNIPEYLKNHTYRNEPTEKTYLDHHGYLKSMFENMYVNII
jgi:hypothetical protein